VKKLRRLMIPILFSLTALPVGATADFGSLWSLACPREGAPAIEWQNRIDNQMAASQVTRVLFEVKPNSNGEWKFDPRESNVLQEWCWDNGTLLQAADDNGAVLAVVFGAEDWQGHPNGYNYHCARNASACKPPSLNKQNWWTYVDSFVRYLEDNHPGMRVIGVNGKGVKYVSFLNEGWYWGRAERPEDFLDWYVDMLDHVRDRLPGSWQLLDGGVASRAGAPKFTFTSRSMYPVFHCNHLTDNQCRAKIQEYVDLYGSVFIDEDVRPGGGSRWYVCNQVPGCKGLFTMYERQSGNPPESTCCWNVGGCSSGDARNFVGVISCRGEMNDYGQEYGFWHRAFRRARRIFGSQAPIGSYDNYQQYYRDGCNAGVCDQDWDFGALANTVEGPPPETDPCLPKLPGMHQELLLQMRLMRAAGYDFPNPGAGKCDPEIRFAYCKKLQMQNAGVQCPNPF